MRPGEGWGAEALAAHLKIALITSVTEERARMRARLWADVVKGSGKTQDDYRAVEDMDGASFAAFASACGLVSELINPFTDNRSRNRLQLRALRNEMIPSYRGASGHKASSSVYFVMLQYLTAAQYGLEPGLDACARGGMRSREAHGLDVVPIRIEEGRGVGVARVARARCVLMTEHVAQGREHRLVEWDAAREILHTKTDVVEHRCLLK
ncbi:hypothetical protein [Corallococcus sp. EGB]|uniref:hypothetical protein n=1 Tax=Corallococcus sp. EGB TaxID=1521117 RepID=UPI001CBBEAA2|nr:hypothetical protein [Corallococcus sp. EGB]